MFDESYRGYELDAYQSDAAATCPPTCAARDVAVFALGIAGEAGEVADLIKKHIGHGHELDKSKLVRELGDVLWYVAGLATVLGVPLSEVAQVNISKLSKRYPNGFSSEASKNRAVDDV